jgi:GSH-dependent disulfide-bond oxidoreductase
VIDLYSFPSPNVRKVVIALAELDLPYRWVWTDIGAGDQFTDEFRAVNPNSKVPAIVDHDGPGGQPIALWESAAILLYLSEKAGGALMPTDPATRWEAMCWLAWQVANHGPMAGQAVHFRRYAPSQGVHDEYAQDRYGREVDRLYAMLEERLADRDYLVGEFTLADVAAFPWVRVAEGYGVDLAAYPRVAAWSDRIAARPSAQVKVPDPRQDDPNTTGYTAEQFARLFRSDTSKATR